MNFLDTRLPKRFWNKVTPEPNSGCWLWIGTSGRCGYGRFHKTGQRVNVMSHRFAYEALVGPIPDGLQLDHLCRTPACVNPAHLEPVTPKENTLRGESFAARNAIAMHCQKGHEFTPDNTLVRPSGWRECRICARSAAARFRKRYGKRKPSLLRGAA